MTNASLFLMGMAAVRLAASARGAGLGAVLALSGCAGASVTHRAPGAIAPYAALSPPAVVFVAVSGPDATTVGADTTFATDLISVLRKADVPAAFLMPGVSDPAVPVLRVTLSQVDPGNAMERRMIGFGVGRSYLAATIQLDDPRRIDRLPATAFDVTADSGRKPGLILPAAVTLGTAVPIHMAIGGGLDLLLGRRQGTDADLQHAAGAIAREVLACYRAMGWSTAL